MAIGNRTLIKTLKSRKHYYCDLCTYCIRVGEHYIKATAQVAGTFITRKYCIGHNWKDVHADMKAIKENVSTVDE